MPTNETFVVNHPGAAAGQYREMIGAAENEFMSARGTDADGNEIVGGGYQFYDAPRIAGRTDMQLAADEARQVQFLAGDPTGAASAGQMTGASDALGVAGGLGQYGGYNPDAYDYSATSGNYDPGSFNAGTFGADQAAYYMNPYQQAVTEQGLAAAREQYDLASQQSDAQRVASGSRGGLRAQMARQRAGTDFAASLGDMQARGSADAWANAQGQFNLDRTANFEAAKFADDSQRFLLDAENKDRQALFQVQQQGNEEQYNAARMEFDARKQNRDAQFKLASGRSDLGMNLNTLGQSWADRENQRIGNLSQSGAERQQLTQAYYDQAWEDTQRQDNYNKDNIDWFARILAGTPTSQSQYSTSPGPDLMSQLLGGAFAGQSLFGNNNQRNNNQP
jgi:hypothetical protein